MKKLSLLFLFMVLVFVPLSICAADLPTVSCTATADGLKFDVAYPDVGKVYAGIYGKSGAMVSFGKNTLINGSSEIQLTADDFDYAKVFVWADELKPLTESARINFKTKKFCSQDVAFFDSTQNTIEIYNTDNSTHQVKINPDKIFINGGDLSVDSACGVVSGTAISAEYYDNVLAYYLDSDNMVDVKLMCHKIVDSSPEDTGDQLIYDTIHITAWQDYLVESVSANNHRVYYNGGVIILDETDTNCDFEIYKDGRSATLSDIKGGDILSVAGYVSDRQLKYGKVYIVSEKVEGIVTAKNITSSTIVIGNTTYPATDSVLSAVVLGDSAIFYKNIRGMLIGIDKASARKNLKYGFVSYIRVDPNFRDACVRMLTSDGVWKTYDVADKFKTVNVYGDGTVKLEESYVDWASEVGGVAGAITDTDMFAVNNLVAYELNDSGEIDVLYMTNNSEVDSGFSSDGIAVSYGTAKDATYVAATGTLGANDIDESTVIFSVDPSFTLGANIRFTDESKVSVVDISALVDREYYNIAAGYNMDPNTFIVSALIGYDIVP